jgi:hypothetical protein
VVRFYLQGADCSADALRHRAYVLASYAGEEYYELLSAETAYRVAAASHR